MDNERKTHFTIGALARELGITTRAIRYYEERGLIQPARTSGGQRIYTRTERGRLKLIQRARRVGFDLEDVREVFAIYDAQPDARGELKQGRRLLELVDQRLVDLDQKIASMKAMRATLRRHRAQLATHLGHADARRAGEHRDGATAVE